MNITSCYLQDAANRSNEHRQLCATPASAQIGMRGGHVTQSNGSVVQKSSIRKLPNRELRRRQRQRKRHKTIGLMSKNNPSARAFYILVHFFAVLCKTTT